LEKPDAVIAFSGELDSSQYPEIVRCFQEIPDGRRVIVDLSAVTLVESTFMGELMLLNRRMQKEGRSVIIVAKGEIARVLVIAGVDKRIPVVADPDAATLLA
jgi:anti-anti-sigma factor